MQPYPEPSITAHIAELLLLIAWAGQNHPMKFEQTTHYVQSTCLRALLVAVVWFSEEKSQQRKVSGRNTCRMKAPPTQEKWGLSQRQLVTSRFSDFTQKRLAARNSFRLLVLCCSS